MMKRMLSLLLVLIMVLGLVPFQVTAQEQSSDVVYADENTSLEELEEMGLVQTSKPINQSFEIPETPTTVKPEADTTTPPMFVQGPSQATPAPADNLCDCGKEDADIYHHSDNCALRAYYLNICAGSAEQIYDLWRNVGVVTQDFLKDYLTANYPEKLTKVYELQEAANTYEKMVAEEEGRLTGEASVTVDGVTVDAVGVPEGSSLTVQEPSKDTMELVEEIVAAAEDEPEQVFLYDISVQNDESDDWQPDGSSVEMTLTIPGLDLYKYTEVRIIHVDDEGNDSLITGIVDENGNIVFETRGFSTFAGFTVDFAYGGVMISIPGKTSTTLGTLFEGMKMPLNPADVVDVQFTDYSLLTVTQEEGDWRLTSLVAFNTNETLTFTMKDGTVYEFMVTDKATPQKYPDIPDIQTGSDGTWYDDDNGVTRWFATDDGTDLKSGLHPSQFQSAYWAVDKIVYIYGTGTFKIQIQPHKDLSRTESNARVRMKQVRVQGGADVQFYVGNHFANPAQANEGLSSPMYTNTKAWNNITGVIIRGSVHDEALFKVEKGTLTLKGTDKIRLYLRGDSETEGDYHGTELVSLGDGATKFVADNVEWYHGSNGGIFCCADRMTEFKLVNCKFRNDVTRVKKDYYGGAIYFYSEEDGAENIVDKVIMQGVVFDKNKAGNQGGAIYFGDGFREITITDYVSGSTTKRTTFTGCNSARSGGAIAFGGTFGKVTINADFTDCTAERDGGALNFVSGLIRNTGNYGRMHTLNLTGCTFTRCIATGTYDDNEKDPSDWYAGSGGGVYIGIQVQNVNITDCTFNGCEAKGGYTNLAGASVCFGYTNVGDHGTEYSGQPDRPWLTAMTWTESGVTKGTDAREVTQGWAMTSDGTTTWRQRTTFGTVNVTDCDFLNAKNTYQGGGFIVRTGTAIEDLNVTNTTFDNCDVADKGSAVFFNNCIVGYADFVNCTIKNCDITDTITEGGGTVRTVGQTSLVLTFDGCKFLDNNGNIAGGGIYWNAGNSRKTPGGIERETKAIVKDCEFRRNKATGTVARPDGLYRYGGGIFCETIMSVERCIFDGNESEIGGGLSMGVYNSDYRMFSDDETTLLILDDQTEFYHNMAVRGGGLAIRANATRAINNDTQLKHTVEFVLNGAKVYNNAASEVGGGIYYVAETYTADPDKPEYDPELDNAEVRRYIKKITLDKGLVYSNCATKDGGGIYVASSYNTTVSVSDASVYSNVAGINSEYTPASTNGDTSCTCEQTKYAIM